MQGLGKEDIADFQRHRYDHLRYGLYRLSLNPDPDEKIFAQVIRSATARIRKRLYPNPLIRALVGLKEFLYDRPVHLRQFQRDRERSLAQLKEQFNRKGFSPSQIKLENLVHTEAIKEKLELGSQLSGGKRLYLTLTFQNKVPGHFMLDKFEVSLAEQGNGNKKTVTFPAASDVTLKDAANLLEGRAIRKRFEKMDGTTAYKWLQADLSMPDEKGNLTVMEFMNDYPFDLKNVLSEFSRSAGITGLSVDSVIRVLEKGNQIKFEGSDRETYYMHANPATQSVGVRDGNGNTIDTARFIERQGEHRKKIDMAKQFSLIRTMKNEKGRSVRISKGI